MAQYRTSPALRAHRELALLKALGGATLAILAYTGLTGGANAPDFGASAALAATAPQPSLTRSGEDVMITGSIDHMFSTGSFAGPNRAEKTDRARPIADVIAVAQSFDAIRARIAAGMTQEKVAARMSTTKSVVSGLESGASTRPTLSTIAKYAIVSLVGCSHKVNGELNCPCPPEPEKPPPASAIYNKALSS